MKELSIENKARRYDEAIERAKEMIKAMTNIGGVAKVDDIQYLFPELKESEDERIRKWIIKQIKTYDPSNIREEALAWLEKQGEQKPVFEMKTPEESLGIDSDTYNKIVDECIYGEQKPTDKVEPKFKVGDWVTNSIETVQITGYDIDYGYQVDYKGNLQHRDTDIIEKEYHLWTIQDAKPGDVLVNQNGEMPFIFKECKNNHIYCYCGYTNRKDIFFDRFVDSEGEELHWLNLYHEQAYPATKEQRNTLMKAMADAGYTFDFEKKELKKIEQKPNRLITAEVKEAMYDKPTWSEGDEKMFQNIINDIAIAQELVYCKSLCEEEINWLESIKERVQPHPNQEWNEKDKHMLQKVIDFMKHPDLIKATPTLSKSTINWLKSLKDRIQLKQEWSEEDERVLSLLLNNYKQAVEHRPSSLTHAEVLDIYNWLKSLRPQNTWKPSDEQMLSLERASNSLVSTEDTVILRKLLSDLKKN